MADRRPNILWYCADQTRFDAAVRAMEYGPRRVMPH
jgi:hypothetical protein